MSEPAKIRKLLRQQSAIARFGSFALRQTDLMAVLTEAAKVCAEGLNVRFSKICRYREAENDLLLEAGYGWQPGIIGHIVAPADSSTPEGRAFVTGMPAVCNDLRMEKNFKLPAFYAEHGIVSTVGVVIKGSNDTPYGVLEIDSDEQDDYDKHDIDFLTGFANVLAEAVATSQRIAVLRVTVERMRILVEEKDRLLDQKKVLAEELQHRVRNNLQLVSGMLSRQLDNTADPTCKRGISAVARRVSTLAQVYDQLLGTEMTRSIDFGLYLQSLCLNIAEFQGVADGGITLACESETLIADLDVVTALGIVVAELVTNSYDHAFPGGTGSIHTSVRRAQDIGKATLTIWDDGAGFTPVNESKRHGLGLVRRLVEEVGGTVKVNSDRGTCWIVEFPVAQDLNAQPTGMRCAEPAMT